MLHEENEAAICRNRGEIMSDKGDAMKDLASARRRYHTAQGNRRGTGGEVVLQLTEQS